MSDDRMTDDEVDELFGYRDATLGTRAPSRRFFEADDDVAEPREELPTPART